MKRFMLVCFLFGCFCYQAQAQLNPKNTRWMEYLEELSEEEASEEAIENLFSELSYLSEHPFNLATVGKEDLERLPFLSDLQIKNLLYYLYRNNPLYSIYELKNVEGLDMQTIEYLLPFVCWEEKEETVRPINLRNTLKYGKHEFLLRYDYCFQEKAGYRNDPEEEKAAYPNRYYLGEPYYTSFKYGFQHKEQIQLGFVAEKDAGEPLWNSRHKGADYFSAHLALKNIGILKSAFVGDYRVAFGQGLIINTDFSLTNTSDVMNVNRKAGNNIKRHYSTSESNYLRGAAGTIQLGETNVSLFYSQRTIDATVSGDSVISSIKTDGYRRTINDMLKKDQAQTRILGGNAQWRNDLVSVGMTALYHDFLGKSLNANIQPYNIYYLRGKSNYNLGVDYSLRRKKLFLQGETAVSRNGAWASTHSLQIYPVTGLSFVMRQRYFAKDYQAQYAAVAGSSSVQNVNGWYLGVVTQPMPLWKISAAVDLVQYPWLKYLIDSPSKSTYALLNLDYSPHAAWKMSVRYKYRERMKNFTLPEQATKVVLPYEQQSLRYQLNIQTHSGLYLKTQLNGNLYQSEHEETSKGYLLAQNVGYAHEKLPIQGDLFLAYFNTDNSSSRISIYEKSILYAFSAPSFSGEGTRSGVTIKWSIVPSLILYLKLAWTHYLDRETISSGLEAIDGCNKVDFYGLIKLKI